jgi:hypothetical protein
MQHKTQLSQVFNQEAINQNIKPIADFFQMHGDETAETYSAFLVETMELYFNDEMNNPRRTTEQMEEITFLIKQLNQLVISLKNPVEWVSSSETEAA